jgi:hypothetical protein
MIEKLEQTNELMKLAEEIRDKRLKVFESKNKINELDLARRNTELTVSVSVAQEMTEDGKKAYTNEQTRKAESDKRLGQNESYQKMMNDIKDLTLDIGREEIVIEFLKNKLRIELSQKEGNVLIGA